MNNDVNVLRQSPIFNDLKSGRAPDVPFVANNVPYKRGYYLTDGIYPQWAVLIKSIKNPGMNDHKRILYKTKHEAARKDMERAFDVLKQNEAISPDFFPEEQHHDDDPVRTDEESMQVTQEIINKTGHLMPITTVKCIPHGFRLAFSQALKTVPYKVVARPDSVDAWVRLKDDCITMLVESMLDGSGLESLGQGGGDFIEERTTGNTSIRQCLRKVADGYFTATVKVLSSSGVAPYCDDTIKFLEAKVSLRRLRSDVVTKLLTPSLVSSDDVAKNCDAVSGHCTRILETISCKVVILSRFFQN
ncbi:ALP1-like protein [Tanacetum coccineum]